MESEEDLENKGSIEFKVGISDWLQYFEHMSSFNLNRLFSSWTLYIMILAVLISAMVFVFSYPITVMIGGIDIRHIFILSVFVTWVYIFTTIIFDTKFSRYAIIRRSAEKFLIDILLNHKYKNSEEIEEEWDKELKKKLTPKEYKFFTGKIES